MDDYLKSALEIVTAQASVRNMTEQEITDMVRNVSAGIQKMSGMLCPSISVGDGTAETGPSCDPAKAIKEKSITCVECGKSFKILTKKHLLIHGLTPAEYRAKYGYKKGMALVCKSLVRERRKKMGEMRLWERRGASKAQAV